MLGHQRQAEPGTDPVASGRAAREALEDALSLAPCHAGTRILDRQQHVGPLAGFDADPLRAATVLARVVEKVGEDALEAQLVDPHRARRGRVDIDRHVAEPVSLGDARHQVVETQLLAVGVRDAGVDARQLQEVEHHLVEPPHLVHHHIEGLLCAFGKVRPSGIEHFDRRAERGDGGPQLVADVGSELRFPLDTGLHRVGHVVERLGEPVELGVALGREPRVQPA